MANSPYIQQIRMIYFAVLLAFTAFMIMICIMQPPDMATDIDWGGLSAAHIATAVYLVIALILSPIAYRRVVAGVEGDRDRLPARHMTAYVLRLAILESAAILSIVMYLIHHDIFFLMTYLVAWLSILIRYPRFDEDGQLV